MDPAKDYGTIVSGLPYGFYFDGGGLVLLPFGTSGTLRVRYYARPGKMVLPAQAQQITSVSVVGTNVSLGFALAPAASLHDIVSSGPAHQQSAIDLLTPNTNPSVVPLASLLETPQVGDWLTGTPDTTPLVPLPEELSASLVLLTGARYLLSRGYLEEAAPLQSNGMQQLLTQTELLRPRSDGNVKRLTGGTLKTLSGFKGPYGNWWRW
jgi:hypothetical protein